MMDHIETNNNSNNNINSSKIEPYQWFIWFTLLLLFLPPVLPNVVLYTSKIPIGFGGGRVHTHNPHQYE